MPVRKLPDYTNEVWCTECSWGDVYLSNAIAWEDLMNHYDDEHDGL